MDLAGVDLEGAGLTLAVVVPIFLAGFRHGFDLDHIVAISDITSSQQDRKRSLFLATTYAVGHMLVLFALGLAAVFLGGRLPAAIDSVAGRIVGFTLVALGIYVLYSVIRFRRDFRMRSRWMLLLAGTRRVFAWLNPPRSVVIEHEHEHSHDRDHAHHPHPLAPEPSWPGSAATRVLAPSHRHSHKHVVTMPPDPFTDYGVKTSFLIGMLHGVGAETPTQILLFVSAAGMAGALGGVVLVATFVLGLLLGNSVLAVATTLGFSSGRGVPYFYAALGVGTAAISIYVGLAYLLRRPDLLPGLLGA